MHRGEFFWKFVFFAALIYLLFHTPIQRFLDSMNGGGIPAVPRPVTPAPANLGADEQATIKIFQEMSPSVCTIKNAALQRDFFSLDVYEVPQGVGSGILWDDSGHVVTNFHVVYQADKLEVILSDHSSYEAKVTGVAPDYDLAVLQIQAPKAVLRPLPLGTSKDLRVGQKVLALGNPFGLDGTLTTGIISALGRTIESMTGHKIQGAIQTDAAINPGNSGGALLDSFGRLIGINTAILSPSGANSGIGFAVPVDTVNRIVPQLITKGRLMRVGIGVSLLPDNLRENWGIPGAVILKVAPGSPAAQAGLQGTRQTLFGKLILGDILVSLEGRPILKNEDLISNLDESKKAGDSIALEFVRNGEKHSLSVMLQEV